MTEEIKTMPTGLYWQGKKTEVDRIVLPFQTIETINESRATREKEKLKGPDIFKTETGGTWHNRLIWGDNKYVMSSLLEEFAGKIDLIYIDPPFATGADFSVKMEIGDAEWTKEPSAIEDKAYRDTWGRGLDSYLQMMYERLVLMRELLSDKGSIYVHCDHRVNSHLRMLLDEIFGTDNFQREIIWTMSAASGYKGMVQNYVRGHETILYYSRGENLIFNKSYLPYSKEQLARFSSIDDDGRHYKVITKTRRLYLDEAKGVPLPDVWSDIANFQTIVNSPEIVGYATQKPESLLERIIKASSNEGDLVADFFCGSGTTGAVAEKLGRRWIMADLGRFAIHTSRKRLLGIEGCSPFAVQNLGKYERQYWQGVTFKKRSDEQIPLYEYIQFILKLYKAEPLAGMLHLHGRKGKRLVHIGAVDAPVTFAEIQEAIAETKKAGQDSLDILGWEWEMGLHDVVEKAAKASGVHLRLFSIPRDVMDDRAVGKGEITFYELAYLEVDIAQDKTGRFVLSLKDFAIPNLDLIPQEVRKIVKKPFDYIDYWAVDWDWNEDTFHNMWQSYRTRKERKLDLKSDGHAYESKGKHLIMVKVIDIFGNDTTKVLEVKS
jgi:DNA modification methylase